jgi:hypothetical protein
VKDSNASIWAACAGVLTLILGGLFLAYTGAQARVLAECAKTGRFHDGRNVMTCQVARLP